MSNATEDKEAHKVREDGFYWVKWNGEWEVAKWYSKTRTWNLPGLSWSYVDDAFQETNEKPICRGGVR